MTTKWIGLLVMAVALGGCKREPTHQRVDAAIAPLIPGDTIALGGLRLDRVKDTPFYRKYVEGKKIGVLETFRAKTGLDPAKDIWEVVWAISPKQRLVFIRGKFGGDFGLEPSFNVPGVLKLNYKSYYILHSEGTGVLFLNSGVAAAGKVEELKQLVDQRDQAGNAPQELLEMVKALPPDHLYAVSKNAGSLMPALPEGGTAANFARLATSIGRFTMHADLRNGVDLQVKAEYAQAETAKQAQDVIRGVLGMVRLKTDSKQGEVLKALDAVTVQARERNLEATMTLPFEAVEKLAGMLLSASGRESRPQD